MDDETEKIINKKKEIMVKSIIIFITVAFFLFIGINIISPFFVLPSEIQELNENTNLSIKFGEPIEKNNFGGEDWKRYDDNDGVDYMKDEDECFGFEGFPDYTNSLKLVRYWSTKSNISIFGIHNGDNFDKANDILKRYGYRQIEKGSNSYTYKKGRITLSFEILLIGESTDDYVVKMIYIDLYTTNWLHKGHQVY